MPEASPQFTDRAKQVVTSAAEVAREFKDEMIGTEHLLYALTNEGGGLALVVIGELGIKPEKIRTRIDATIKRGGRHPYNPITPMPFTQRTKDALQYAHDEAFGQGCGFTNTGHLLLALMWMTSGTASQILHNCGLDGGYYAMIKEEVAKRSPQSEVEE